MAASVDQDDLDYLRIEIDAMAQHAAYVINYRTQFMINSFEQRARLHNSLSNTVVAVGAYAYTQSVWAAFGMLALLWLVNFFIIEPMLERAVKADFANLGDVSFTRLARRGSWAEEDDD